MGQNTQAALTIVGYAVGTYFGYPQLGAIVGSFVGGAIQTANTKISGARLTDLKTPSFEYGTPIHRLYGRARLPGNVIWASAKREVAHTTGGKGGGPEITQYTYEMDLLVLLCDNPILGVSRIWANGELVYTAHEQSDLPSLAASGASELWGDLRVYVGSDDQLPDPVYEDAVGLGNAPAYRGRGTIMIASLSLGNSGQMPILTYEVTTAGTYGLQTPVELALIPGYAEFNCGTAATGDDTFRIAVGQWDAFYASNQVLVYDVHILTGEVEEVGQFAVANQTWALATGNSDVAVFHQSQGTAGVSNAFGVSLATYVYSENLGGQQVRFSRLGDDIVIGSALFGSKKLYRHASAGGTAVVSSAALPDYVNSILILNGMVYAASKNQKTIYRLDLATLTLQSTINRPSFGSGLPDSWPQLVELDGELCLLTDFNDYTVYLYRQSAWLALGKIDSASLATLDTYCPSSFFIGNVLTGGLSTNAPAYRAWGAGLVYTPQPVDLADVVTDLCVQAGIDETLIDASELEGTEIFGVPITQVSPARSTLETLSGAFFFECVESDKLYFRLRGRAAAATIPFQDLGAAENGADGEDPVGLERGSDVEVAAGIALQYINADDDYQTATAYFDRLVSQTAEVRPAQLPLVLQPAVAQGMVDAMVLDGRVSATQVKPAIDDTRPRLEPTDVLLVEDADDEATYRARIVRMTYAAGVRKLECVLDDAGLLPTADDAVNVYEPTMTVLKFSDTVLALLDIPILRDMDDGSGIYAAVAPAGPKWPGAEIFAGATENSFGSQAVVTKAATIGHAKTVLADWTGGNVFDEDSSVLVYLPRGSLSSVTRDAMLDQNANAAALGAEIIQFRTATLTSEHEYLLTGLLRGRRGTEWATGEHGIGDQFVLLNGLGTVRIPDDLSQLDVERYWRAVTLGRAIDTAESLLFADTGVALMPFAPVDLRVDRDTPGLVSVTWSRRSRLSDRFPSTTLPLGEATEAYDVDVYDAADAFVRTDRVTEPVWSSSGVETAHEFDLPIVVRVLSDGVYYGHTRGESTGGAKVYAINDDGTLLAVSPSLGDAVRGFAMDGSNIYIATDASSGAATDDRHVYRFDKNNLGSAQVDYNPSTLFYFFAGLVFDGTNVFVGDSTGSLLRLDATTLAVLNTYAIGTGQVQELHYDGAGHIYVVNNNAGAISTRKFTIASGTVTWTQAGIGHSPFVIGSTLFMGTNPIRGYSVTTGAETLASESLGVGYTVQALGQLGSVLVAYLRSPNFTNHWYLATFDPATLEELQRVDIGLTTTDNFISLPVLDGEVWVGSSSYVLSAGGIDGYSLTIYQISASIGRGYPASITI